LAGPALLILTLNARVGPARLFALGPGRDDPPNRRPA